MSTLKWLLYGAGVTGTLIAEEALWRGHRPLLAGRSPDKLKPLAEQLGPEWVTVDLNNPAALSQVIAEVDLVLHTAGPFTLTSAPMVRACLANGKPYLDISNEIPVFQSIRAYDAEARQRGVALIPGVGCGVVASDGLAQSVAAQVPEAKELEVAIQLYINAASLGAEKTRLELLAKGGWVRRNGQLVQTPMGRGAKQLLLPTGEQTIVPILSGDLEAAIHNTGIPNITVYGVFAMAPWLARVALPLLQQLVSYPVIRRQLERRSSSRLQANGKSSPAANGSTPTARSYVWARARNRRGQIVEAWQEFGEGYAFTAAVAVRAVEQVFERRPIGALTPAQAFGADFALNIDGVKRYEVRKG